MPKAPRRKSIKAGSTPRRYYRLVPWQCRNHSDRSELTAYVEASGKWETVAVVPPTSGASAEALANYILALVNNSLPNSDLLRDAMSALEAVMKDGLTFTTEQEADSVVKCIKLVIS
jgi:hypothetical protein